MRPLNIFQNPQFSPEELLKKTLKSGTKTEVFTQDLIGLDYLYF